MKKLLFVTLSVAALMLAAPLAQAQGKIATVDMKKVFDGYWKTKIADANLKEMGREAQKRLTGMVEDGKKLQEEYKKLVESANDQAVSVDEREKRKKGAESKLLEFRELESQITQYDRSASTKINEKREQDREKIVKEITDAIAAKAKAGGYSMAIDIAAESFNRTLIVPYTDGSNDITQEVLSHVNVNAPSDVGTAKDEKKK
jgi:outer membrane protein